MRVAIIDLGTNTFNLFIADLNADGKPEAVFKTRTPVRLGDRINDAIISSEAYERGLESVEYFSVILKKHHAERVLAFGTSAIRSATNGKQFCDDVRSRTGIDVMIIDGNEEAEYIYRGVREAVSMNDEKVLILDIGGGSNELIIANHDTIFWKKSFNLGIARLLQLFSPDDPLPKDQEENIKAYLRKELQPLTEAVKLFPVTELIGASGSFETFAELSAKKKDSSFKWNGHTEYTFCEGEYEEVYSDLVGTKKEERLVMEGMLSMRADMIVLAGVFVNVVLEECGIRKMRVSDYALKEGALFRILKT